MNDIIFLLEKYKKVFNLKNDKELAKNLGISNSFLCDIKKFKRKISGSLIIEMAKKCKLKEDKYLIAARTAYAKTIEEKIIWKKIMMKYCDYNQKTTEEVT